MQSPQFYFRGQAVLTMSSLKFETLKVTREAPHVVHVEFNRPEQHNAMNVEFWTELRECFDALRDDATCRAIVFSGAGEVFSPGLDASALHQLMSITNGERDVARKCRELYKLLRLSQESFTAIEKCPKPVISCIHSKCEGGGLSLICATDIRYCTADASFSVKGVDKGLASDVGALQRMPRIVGNESVVRELAFTSRNMYAEEAFRCGLVGKIFPDKPSMITAALDLAKSIASKSPVAVQGTKHHLNYGRDHTIEEGLEAIATWNMVMLQSEDLAKSAKAAMTKTQAQFADY